MSNEQEPSPINEQEQSLVSEGETILYAIEDSGTDFPHEGVTLWPGEPLVVGVDINVPFASRLVERGICTVQSPPNQVMDNSPADNRPATRLKAAKPASDSSPALEKPGTDGNADAPTG